MEEVLCLLSQAKEPLRQIVRTTALKAIRFARAVRFSRSKWKAFVDKRCRPLPTKVADQHLDGVRLHLGGPRGVPRAKKNMLKSWGKTGAKRLFAPANLRGRPTILVGFVAAVSLLEWMGLRWRLLRPLRSPLAAFRGRGYSRQPKDASLAL
jgi:hypothetical protein